MTAQEELELLKLRAVKLSQLISGAKMAGDIDSVLLFEQELIEVNNAINVTTK